MLRVVVCFCARISPACDYSCEVKTVMLFSSNVIRQAEERSMLAKDLRQDNKRRLGENKAKDDDLG
jgi:hypothetical protein